MVGTKLYGDYHHIILHKNCDINYGCFLLSKSKIEMGDNTVMSYKVTIIIIAAPNGEYNSLRKLHPDIKFSFSLLIKMGYPF